MLSLSIRGVVAEICSAHDEDQRVECSSFSHSSIKTAINEHGHATDKTQVLSKCTTPNRNLLGRLVRC